MIRENPIGEGLPIRHTRTSPQPDLLMEIMWHWWRFRASSSLAPHPQRHITPNATEDIKLDGYRAIAVKSDEKVRLFSRRQKSFNQQYPCIVEALVDPPDGTVIDGEIGALDDSARPQFNLLQNYRSEARRIRYFIFDLLCYDNRDTTSLPLIERRALLRKLKFQSPRIQFLDFLETSAANMVAAAKQQGLEGVIAKRKDSLYQPGRRTGAWIKHRISQGQEFVIGGYFPGPHGFDSIIVGYLRL